MGGSCMQEFEKIGYQMIWTGVKFRCDFARCSSFGHERSGGSRSVVRRHSWYFQGGLWEKERVEEYDSLNSKIDIYQRVKYLKLCSDWLKFGGLSCWVSLYVTCSLAWCGQVKSNGVTLRAKPSLRIFSKLITIDEIRIIENCQSLGQLFFPPKKYGFYF